MIEPIHSLAFTIQANPGVYALLLGSGVSRPAKIPTGWEVTLDLIRKLATVSGESCDPSPEQWYREKFRREPEYSALLDALAKTPAERQQLLRGYWEPSEQEREEGAKQPTAAHRAIASLVAQKFVKVIITTNFDRLAEIALADIGVVPSVLSTPDQVNGALPLIHNRCCILKINGDYLDTRIRNTPAELSTYPEELDALLDRIFDEFGLIVCAWSAEWDEALRAAIIRAPSRRFTTYWALRGEPSQAAQQLITHRGAQVIRIVDADSFFRSVQQQVESLEQFSQPHPLSTEAAVASLKRYLAEPHFRILLTDLVSDEIERVVEATTGEKFAVQGGPPPDSALATYRVRAYEAACTTLLEMAPIGGFWAEQQHDYDWRRALERLSFVEPGGGYVLWSELQRYRATLLLYSLGIGAIEAGNLPFLRRLFTMPIHRENREDIRLIQLLPPSCLFGSGGQTARFLEGMENRHAPLNDWLHNVLHVHTKRLIPNESRYTMVFDKLEILVALGYACHAKRATDRYWVPLGAYGYRSDNRERVLQEIQDSIASMRDESPFVTSGIIGNSTQDCTHAVSAFSEFSQGLHW